MRFENIILDILRVLPKSVLKLIAGPPLVIDGNQTNSIDKIKDSDIDASDEELYKAAAAASNS